MQQAAQKWLVVVFMLRIAPLKPHDVISLCNKHPYATLGCAVVTTAVITAATMYCLQTCKQKALPVLPVAQPSPETPQYISEQSGWRSFLKDPTSTIYPLIFYDKDAKDLAAAMETTLNIEFQKILPLAQLKTDYISFWKLSVQEDVPLTCSCLALWRLPEKISGSDLEKFQDVHFMPATQFSHATRYGRPYLQDKRTIHAMPESYLKNHLVKLAGTKPAAHINQEYRVVPVEDKINNTTRDAQSLGSTAHLLIQLLTRHKPAIFDNLPELGPTAQLTQRAVIFLEVATQNSSIQRVINLCASYGLPLTFKHQAFWLGPQHTHEEIAK